MKGFKFSYLGAVFLSILFIFLSRFPARAATSISPTGLTVSPAFQQVSLRATEDEHLVAFTLKNNRPVSQIFDLSVADFNTLGESGGVLFVGTNPIELQKKYGLAKWVELDQNNINLLPGQSVTVHAKILNLPTLSPGGHYGALMVTASNQASLSTKNRVSLQPIASSLMFVTKIGGDTHKLSLENVSIKHSLFSLPRDINLKFHNDGNTHVIPRGNVSLVDPAGNIVSKGIINEDSNIILPETTRQFYSTLKSVKSSNSTGHYKIRVDFRFDGFDQYRRYQQSFTHINPFFLIIIPVILLVGGLGLANPAWFKWYFKKFKKQIHRHKK